jgi:hypothetical protein
MKNEFVTLSRELVAEAAIMLKQTGSDDALAEDLRAALATLAETVPPAGGEVDSLNAVKVERYHAHQVADTGRRGLWVHAGDFNSVVTRLQAEVERLTYGPPHFCGMPMSLNPHVDAGVPGRFLEVGAVRECIPCLVKSRHEWATKAGALQSELTKARELLVKYPGQTNSIYEKAWVRERSTFLSNQSAPADKGQGELVAFQARVKPWMLECFGETISRDRQERNHRFLEEALELVQACGCTPGEAHQLIEYVYGRPAGDPVQEVGGVMVTLAALCLAHGMDMHAAGETELARIWTKVEQIRAKQAAKPAMSPLPGAYPDRDQPAPVAVVMPTQRGVPTHNSHDWDEGYNDGWKAYGDELKRLNPSL